ncbi:phage tail assembly chaperone [Methylobacterium isbiliense]|uniref:phage tail assembly chaperone n=1 Tax=Methylobacterium isbiliense TaxID=315478 RepID=UPI003F49768F
MPPAGAHVWRWFWSLSNQRTGTGSGPNALPFSEIEAWGRLKRIRLKRWELDAILAMDRVYGDVIVARIKAEAGREGEGDAPLGPPLTADAFDALFG